MRNIAKVHLTKEEREQILDTMTGEQRDFLLTKLKRGRKNAFANGLIEKIGEELKSKHGNSLLFDNVDLDSETEWELVEIVDAGKRVDYLKCECGLTLRYQYVVRQQGTGIEKKFGKRHFALHMGIPEHIAKAVINNISKIDMELDEILSKYQANELNYGYMVEFVQKYSFLFEDTFQKQVKLGLPLLDVQIKSVMKVISDYQKPRFNFLETSANVLINDNKFPQFELQLDEEELAPIEKRTNYEDITWTKRMSILKSIESSSTYRYELFEHILTCLENGVNGANEIVEQLLEEPIYQSLFKQCSQRMCYRLVTARITEAILSGTAIMRETTADRSNTYYFLGEKD